MPLLYHWQGDIYHRDTRAGFNYKLSQKNPVLHQIEIGDSLWAFTRNRNGDYVLAAELIVSEKVTNPPDHPYGTYGIIGDKSKSHYFQIDEQSSIEPVIRSLSVSAKAEVLGNSFQGGAAVRLITQEDHEILKEAARDLPQHSEVKAILDLQSLLRPTAMADLISSTRDAAGLSPDELAIKAGLSPSMIVEVERGLIPSPDTFNKIVKALNTDSIVYETILSPLAKKVRETRTRLRLSPQKLSELSGVSLGTLTPIEKGYIPSPNSRANNIEKLQQTFNRLLQTDG